MEVSRERWTYSGVPASAHRRSTGSTAIPSTRSSVSTSGASFPWASTTGIRGRSTTSPGLATTTSVSVSAPDSPSMSPTTSVPNMPG
jgi:hypothetical protein